MKLADDWKCILKKAWSIKLILAAGFFSGLEAVVQIYSALADLPAWMPRGGFAAIAFIASNGAFVMRLVAQKGMPNGTDE